MFVQKNNARVSHSYLHDRVVSRYVDREQVKVSGGEDKCKQHLRLPRDAYRDKKKVQLTDRRRKYHVVSSWMI